MSACVRPCLAAQLVLNGKGWMGHRTDSILHAGEGTVHVVRWAGSLIAWANDVGRRSGVGYVTTEKQE